MLSPFSKTIGRLGFLVRSVLLLALFFTAVLLLVPENDAAHTTEYWEFLGAISAVCLIVVWLFYAVVPRCRDIALPWWSALGMLLPILNMIFALFLLIKKAETTGDR